MQKKISAVILVITIILCFIPFYSYASNEGKWYYTLRGDDMDEVGSTHVFPMSDYNDEIFISHVFVKKGKLIIDKYVYETSDPYDSMGIYTEYKLLKDKKTKYKIAKNCKVYRVTTETGNPKDSKLEEATMADFKEKIGMRTAAYQGISFKVKNKKVVKIFM